MVDRYGQRVEQTGARAGMVTDEGLRAYMLKVYNYMTSGVLLTGIVALLTSQSPFMLNLIFGSSFYYVILFSPFIFVILMSFRAQKMSVFSLQAMFWGFAATLGLSLSSIFLIYSLPSIGKIFFITAAAFGSLSLWGYTTKKDLSGWGAFLMMGLVGVFLALVVNWWLLSPALDFVVSIIGVLVFAGLTAYDTQKIKNMYYQYQDGTMVKKGAIMGALSLYLDFINMFLFLLRIFGNRS